MGKESIGKVMVYFLEDVMAMIPTFWHSHSYVNPPTS